MKLKYLLPRKYTGSYNILTSEAILFAGDNDYEDREPYDLFSSQTDIRSIGKNDNLNRSITFLNANFLHDSVPEREKRIYATKFRFLPASPDTKKKSILRKSKSSDKHSVKALDDDKSKGKVSDFHIYLCSLYPTKLMNSIVN